MASMCAACGQPGHRFGFNEGPDRFDPTACINGLLWDLEAARRAHRVAVRALSRALGERDRLADGIQWHRDNYSQVWTRLLAPHPRDIALWALLDVTGDDPPVPYRALEGSEGGEDDR